MRCRLRLRLRQRVRRTCLLCRSCRRYIPPAGGCSSRAARPSVRPPPLTHTHYTTDSLCAPLASRWRCTSITSRHSNQHQHQHDGSDCCCGLQLPLAPQAGCPVPCPASAADRRVALPRSASSHPLSRARLASTSRHVRRRAGAVRCQGGQGRAGQGGVMPKMASSWTGPSPRNVIGCRALR